MRRSSGPCFTSSRLPDTSRLMKNREVGCWMAEGFSSGQVLPRSVETLSPMPYFVRTSNQIEPLVRSTNMCSSASRASLGTLQLPRRVQVLPASVETTSCALWSPTLQLLSPHWLIGSPHSPEESKSGLHIITPSLMRRGGDHSGCAASGWAVSAHHTSGLAEGRLCAQKKNRRPSGDNHNSGSNARTGPPASGSTMSTSCQVAPLSPLVQSTT